MVWLLTELGFVVNYREFRTENINLDIAKARLRRYRSSAATIGAAVLTVF